MSTVRSTEFELTGVDGGPLRGNVRTAGDGAGRPAVVICHGFKGFKDWGFFPRLAVRLSLAGATAVSFNFSGSGVGPDGESFSELERFGHATLSGDLRDIDIVSSALRDGTLVKGLLPPPAIGLFGHSRGGGATVLYAASNDHIGVLVTWAAISTIDRWPPEAVEDWRQTGRMDIVNARTGQVMPLFLDLLDDVKQNGDDRLNIAAAASHISIPWLIVHGAADEAVSVEDAKLLARAAAPGTADLRIIPGAGHTFGAKHPWAGTTPELQTALDDTVAWFARHIM
jgi:dienelactone hydrolase